MRFSNILTEIIPKHPGYRHMSLVDSATYRDLYQVNMIIKCSISRYRCRNMCFSMVLFFKKIDNVITVSELLKEKILQKPAITAVKPTEKQQSLLEKTSNDNLVHPFMVQPHEVARKSPNLSPNALEDLNSERKSIFENSVLVRRYHA